ncbi:hypothetical protein ACLESD_22660, partial [Pyxidicoccus sp. 3LFB2]
MAPISLKKKLDVAFKPAPAPAARPAPAPKKAPVAQTAARATSSFQQAARKPAPVDLNPASRAERALSEARPVRAADVLRQGGAAFKPAPGVLGGMGPSSLPGLKLSSAPGTRLPPSVALNARLGLGRDIGGLTLEGRTVLGSKVALAAGGLEGKRSLLGKDLLGALPEHVRDRLAAGAPGQVLATQQYSPVTGSPAAQAVETAYRTGGAQAAAEELEQQTALLGNDQAAVDALLAETQPTLDKVAEDLVQDEESGADARAHAT